MGSLYDRLTTIMTSLHLCSAIQISHLFSIEEQKNLALYHYVGNETVDVDALALMTESKTVLTQPNRVQYKTYSIKRDCYK